MLTLTPRAVYFSLALTRSALNTGLASKRKISVEPLEPLKHLVGQIWGRKKKKSRTNHIGVWGGRLTGILMSSPGRPGVVVLEL